MGLSIPKPGRLLAGAALSGIFAGGWPARRIRQLAEVLWALTAAAALAPPALTVAADWRRGELGVDLIALLAMAGSPALGEYLAAS